MGFFSNLGNALSGKTYKQNVLFENNIIKLLKNAEGENEFV